MTSFYNHLFCSILSPYLSAHLTLFSCHFIRFLSKRYFLNSIKIFSFILGSERSLDCTTKWRWSLGDSETLIIYFFNFFLQLRDTENKPQSLYLLPESMCLLSASGSSTLRYIARKVGTSTGYKNVKSKDKI